MTLADRWSELKRDEPKLRIRDAAERLDSNEATLLATTDATPLRPEFGEILKRFKQVGRTMCLTRNDACVHERVGTWDKVVIAPTHSLVLGPDIDLRLFMGKWASAFVVDNAEREMRSIQFFDLHGDAVLKVYVGPRWGPRTEAQDVAWQAIVDDLRAPELRVSTQPKAAPEPDRPDAEIDVPALNQAWEALQDTHAFFGMLREHQVGRLQALRLTGVERARPVAPELEAFLNTAAERAVPIMCFVGSLGCIQIHTGPVERIKPMGRWINVLDPDFNLHLDTSRVASAWVVRKPTKDGDVHSLELFDAQGQVIAMFFGKRKEGLQELPEWRGLLETLSTL